MKLVHWLLRFSFVRFAIVGGAGYVVDAGMLALGTGVLKLEFAPARALSIFIAMCFTWIGNRYLTFPERRARTASGAAQEWLKFVGANSFGALVNFGVSVGLVRYAPWPASNYFVAQACGVLAGLVFNFTLSRALVFRAPSGFPPART